MVYITPSPACLNATIRHKKYHTLCGVKACIASDCMITVRPLSILTYADVARIITILLIIHVMSRYDLTCHICLIYVGVDQNFVIVRSY